MVLVVLLYFGKTLAVAESIKLLHGTGILLMNY